MECNALRQAVRLSDWLSVELRHRHSTVSELRIAGFLLSHAASSASAGPQCAVHHHMAMQKQVLHEMAARYLLHHNEFFSDWCAVVL